MQIIITATTTAEALEEIAKAFDRNASNSLTRASNELVAREKHALMRECNTWRAAASFLRAIKIKTPED